MTKSHELKTGVRIRERRLDRGIRQADLAAEVGISPSYLNLIEHNRRRIAGTLLADIARVLAVEPAFLVAGADRAVLDRMRQAAAAFPEANAEIERTEDMAARYPGWAGVIAAQAARIDGLERQVQVLNDRMANDPALATSLHGVISAVTSIRSTAAILTSDEKLDADWQGRFHRNIHDDSVRLAAQSEALMAYLETPEEEAGGLLLSPAEEMEGWLADHGHCFEAVEDGGAHAAVLDKASGLRAPARALLSDYLDQYQQDAAVLPMAALTSAINGIGADPIAIARETGAPLPVVIRRLIAVPTAMDLPPMGLAMCDSGGYLHFLKTAPGFTMPRAAACPLWPLYAALGQVGRAIRQDVVLSGTPDVRIRCTAIAEFLPQSDYSQPPAARAMMLVVPDTDPDETTPVPIGVTCRICPRSTCHARREPSALAHGL